MIDMVCILNSLKEPDLQGLALWWYDFCHTNILKAISIQNGIYNN